MTAASEPEALLIAADRLISAIERHSLVLTQDPDNPAEVVRATDAVTGATREYVEAVSSKTGWGNPFIDIGEDEEQPRQVTAGNGSDILVEAEYTLRVNDIRAAADMLQKRRITTGRPVCDDFGDNPVDIVHALFRIDGWNPGAYGSSAVEVLSQEWSCGPLEGE